LYNNAFTSPGISQLTRRSRLTDNRSSPPSCLSQGPRHRGVRRCRSRSNTCKCDVSGTGRPTRRRRPAARQSDRAPRPRSGDQCRRRKSPLIKIPTTALSVAGRHVRSARRRVASPFATIEGGGAFCRPHLLIDAVRVSPTLHLLAVYDSDQIDLTPSGQRPRVSSTFF